MEKGIFFRKVRKWLMGKGLGRLRPLDHARAALSEVEGRISDFGPKGAYEGTGTPRGSNGEQGDCGLNSDPPSPRQVESPAATRLRRASGSTARSPVSTRNAECFHCGFRSPRRPGIAD